MAYAITMFLKFLPERGGRQIKAAAADVAAKLKFIMHYIKLTVFARMLL